MHITKISYDTSYPYVIEDSWGQKMSCSREDLIALKEEIDRVLNTSTNSVPNSKPCYLGGQMVRKMIEAYERNN